jgi:glycosyltransferase involved in cell wall biosynthesis
MTILVTIPWRWGGVGGINEVVRNLLLFLAKHPEYGRPVLVTEGGGAPVRLSDDRVVDTVELPAFGLPSARQPLYWASYVLKYWWRAQKWRRFMDDNGVTAVHIHPGDLGAVAVAWTAARLAASRPRITISFHGFDVENIRLARRSRKRVYSWLLTQVDAINVCSDWLKEQLIATGVAGQGDVIVCHNGVDAGQLDRDSAGKAPPLPGPQRTVAFDAVASAAPDVALVIAGDFGPESAALAAAAKSSPFASRISLIGPVEHGELLARLRCSCVAVLPSRREPFGIVLLEAAWAGVPLVAARVGGIPEIVLDGCSGLLVPSEDHAALATAILRIVSNPDLGANLARNARERVLPKFTWEKQAPRYLGLSN